MSKLSHIWGSTILFTFVLKTASLSTTRPTLCYFVLSRKIITILQLVSKLVQKQKKRMKVSKKNLGIRQNNNNKFTFHLRLNQEEYKAYETSQLLWRKGK